ncbi:MAG: DNA topoisomerase I [bacterium]|nr:DNA topoisomerase I [bacterium]
MKKILILTEKPSVARKFAEYVFKQFKEKRFGKARYYIAARQGQVYYIVSCVGHLYTLAPAAQSFPLLDYKWVPVYQAERRKAYTRIYLELLKKLSKEVDEVLVATDYDIEGELIAYNVLEYCLKKPAKRLVFSEITPRALKKAMENPQGLNFGYIYAGIARHVLDWLFGINFSRLLQREFGIKRLSAGRVQTPVLRLIYERELEIARFVPEKYYKVRLYSKYITVDHEKTFKDKKSAEQLAACGASEAEVLDSVQQELVQPPPPFCLSTLQAEAWRIFRLNPAKTLRVAQKLYEQGYISYPRTSSEKYPKDIDFREILAGLARLEKYRKTIQRILSSPLAPKEGEKVDPAHPCIYPTGQVPKKLSRREAMVYHLVVRRFLATLLPPVKVARHKIRIRCGQLLFVDERLEVLESGWLEVYPVRLGKQYRPLPSRFSCRLKIIEAKTKPPPRYTPAALVKLMEQLGLGTKATRAEIIEKLYKRGYIKGRRAKITSLGKQVIEFLLCKYPKIASVELTREFEKRIEEIEKGGKEMLEKIIREYKELIKSLLD